MSTPVETGTSSYAGLQSFMPQAPVILPRFEILYTPGEQS